MAISNLYQTLKDVFMLLRMKNKCQKWQILHVLSKKMLKFVTLKCWNHSTTTKNYAVNFYKTLKEVPWHLGVKELKKLPKFF